ncbi:MAG: hypothetical protein C4523_08940 [Myxococcales bacterium]|nr:MAG: hypothetical protein C4523_08940 [Myxococcales bacterium]
MGTAHHQQHGPASASERSVGQVPPASASPASFRARSVSDGSSLDDHSFRAATLRATEEGARRERSSAPASASERSSSAGHAAAHPPNPDTLAPLAVCIETAHPAKFPDELRALINLDPEIPPSLAGLDQKPEHFERMSNDYNRLFSFLTERSV